MDTYLICWGGKAQDYEKTVVNKNECYFCQPGWAINLWKCMRLATSEIGLLLITLLLAVLVLVLALESFLGDLIDAHDGLIGVPHDHILAIGPLAKQLNEHADEAPHASLGKGNLGGEVPGSIKLSGQYDMVGGVLDVGPADEADLHLRCTRQDTLGSPLGELEGVVLEFVGEDSTTLGIDLVPPVDAGEGLGRVELVEGKSRHVVGVIRPAGPAAGLLLDDTMQLGTGNELDVVTKVEAAVSVGDGGRLHPVVVLDVKEGVGEVEGLSRLGGLEDLLAEVLVDHGRLEAKAFGSVDALGIVLLFLGRIIGRLVDGEIVELAGVTLVEEEGAGAWKLLDNDVPGVDGAGAGHEVSQDGIGREHIAHAVDSELLDDRVVRRRDGVELLVLHPLEGDGRSGRDAVVRVVVGVQEAAPEQVLFLERCIRVYDVLGYLGEVHLVHPLPVRPHGNGGLAVDAVAPTPPTPAPAPPAAAWPSAPAAARTAAPTWAVPPRPLGDVLVLGPRSGVGALPPLLGVELAEAVHLLPLAGGGDEAPGLRLGRVDKLEGSVLFDVRPVRELGVAALPVPPQAATIPLPEKVGLVRRGEVRRATEAVPAAEWGEGEAGEFGRGTVGVSIVLPIEGGRAPRVGVRRHVGGLESHCVGVAGEVSELRRGNEKL